LLGGAEELGSAVEVSLSQLWRLWWPLLPRLSTGAATPKLLFLFTAARECCRVRRSVPRLRAC